jgi:hypothetical protein
VGPDDLDGFGQPVVARCVDGLKIVERAQDVARFGDFRRERRW